MIRLNNILENTDSRVWGNPIDIKQCISIIKENNININNIKMYREMQSKEPVLYFKSDNNMNRRSRSSLNYYNLLFSGVLPSWKGIPPRNKSLICTTKKESTKMYGNTYAVFPIDKNSVIAMLSVDDIYSVIIDDAPDIQILDRALRSMSLSLFNKEKNNSVDELLELINTISEQKQNFIKSDASVSMFFLNWLYKYRGSFLSYLDELYSPSNMEITTESYKDMYVYDEDDLEVWTASDCLLISLGALVRINYNFNRY